MNLARSIYHASDIWTQRLVVFLVIVFIAWLVLA
jgi:hypothetical protein